MRIDERLSVPAWYCQDPPLPGQARLGPEWDRRAFGLRLPLDPVLGTASVLLHAPCPGPCGDCRERLDMCPVASLAGPCGDSRTIHGIECSWCLCTGVAFRDCRTLGGSPDPNGNASPEQAAFWQRGKWIANLSWPNLCPPGSNAHVRGLPRQRVMSQADFSQNWSKQ